MYQLASPASMLPSSIEYSRDTVAVFCGTPGNLLPLTLALTFNAKPFRCDFPRLVLTVRMVVCVTSFGFGPMTRSVMT